MPLNTLSPPCSCTMPLNAECKYLRETERNLMNNSDLNKKTLDKKLDFPIVSSSEKLDFPIAPSSELILRTKVLEVMSGFKADSRLCNGCVHQAVAAKVVNRPYVANKVHS